MMKSMKKSLFILAALTMMVSCMESKTENAIEDVGENIERAAENTKDGIEDVADDIKDATN